MPAALDPVSERPPQCGAFGGELVDGVLDQVGSFRVASADREVLRLDLGMEDLASGLSVEAAGHPGVGLGSLLFGSWARVSVVWVCGHRGGKGVRW